VPVHVVVVGCGRVGSSLALDLVADGHSVSIIDKNPAAFGRFLLPGWGGSEVIGFGFDRDHLLLAGADRAGGLAAVTSGDNSNILTARIARETFDIPAVVARIYDPRRAEIYQRLGIPTVATATWTIEQVRRRLFPDRSVGEWSDPTGQLEMLQRVVPLTWCGRRLSSIESESGARIVAVTRGSVVQLGPGDLIAQEGDVLHVAVAIADRPKLFAVLGEQSEAGHREAGHSEATHSEVRT
jgi:trk system potassium uptake protein TrkA